jgi:hypothetical protein
VPAELSKVGYNCPSSANAKPGEASLLPVPRGVMFVPSGNPLSEVSEEETRKS